MIDTHQELVLALAEAAELEHSLICQYLFAAYSVKTSLDGISGADAQRFAGWRERVLGVARQEMGHLATVWNIQALVGAAPYSGRINFPQPGGRFYPPEIDFALTAFNRETLARFIEFERPQTVVVAGFVGAPDPLQYSRVGDLYRQIRKAVEVLADNQLLVNSAAVQDNLSWSNNVTVETATTRNEILSAIDFIIVQGEGSPGSATGSHFYEFSALDAELVTHLHQGGVAPSRDVVSNPWTVTHRDAEGGTLIEEPSAAQAVAVFNLLYGSLLQLLRHYYAGGTETADQRENLKMAAYKLGELLTRMPALVGQDRRAGPSFEHFGPEDLAAVPHVVWEVVVGRLTSARDALGALATTSGPAFLAASKSVQVVLDWLTADFPVETAT